MTLLVVTTKCVVDHLIYRMPNHAAATSNTMTPTRAQLSPGPMSSTIVSASAPRRANAVSAKKITCGWRSSAICSPVFSSLRGYGMARSVLTASISTVRCDAPQRSTVAIAAPTGCPHGVHRVVHNLSRDVEKCRELLDETKTKAHIAQHQRHGPQGGAGRKQSKKPASARAWGKRLRRTGVRSGHGRRAPLVGARRAGTRPGPERQRRRKATRSARSATGTAPRSPEGERRKASTGWLLGAAPFFAPGL